MRTIGVRNFSQEDQQLFALVSLDRNPMHMDPIASRRLLSGRQIVHGIHVMLTAVELWQESGSSDPVSISCSFDSPIGVGDTVIFTQTDSGEGSVIEAAVNGLLCAQIVLKTASAGNDGNPDADSPSRDAGTTMCRPEELAGPLDEAPQSHLEKSYLVEPNSADFSAEFPHAHRCLGKERFAAIAALSYFVGMICPGLHSIFSSVSVDLSCCSSGTHPLVFRVRKYDPRARLFDVSFHGSIDGSLKAFLRPPPQEQPSMQDASLHVAAEEFRGTRSLIIGGSRGLGEVTAKVLAAGGGDVIITYSTGLDDARRICDEINRHGSATCRLLKFDLTRDTCVSLSADDASVDMVYYFATPRIYRKKAATFDAHLFREFCDFYVEKFFELCVYLENGSAGKKVAVYFPSSVFVAERPRGMTEYAMAKAAAEVLAEDINRSLENVSVLATRLPRLTTDQTASILKISTGSNLQALLPIIRQLSRQV